MDELITAKEAAGILDCTTNQLRRIARQGSLQVRFDNGQVRGNARYKRSEVNALAEIREKKLSLPQVAAMAQRAYVSSRALETRVERLLEVMNIDIPRLPLDKQSVQSMYVHIEDTLAMDPLILSPEDVYEWAKRLYGMGEEYFGLIEKYCGDNEPWQKPLKLARKISLDAPNAHIDRQSDEAYSRFEFARKSLRHAAYFYVREGHGKPIASRLFPETIGDVNQKIMAMMFADE